ncbi:MAG: PrsW family glutamic-type intramembrane protease, partial [Candidatus Binatia bacterium]
LSVLKPESRWQILGIGYLTASVLHALWNSVGTLGVGFYVVVGGVSYVFLSAAILKARQLSPTRAQNFATQVIGAGAAPQARFSLQVAGRTIPLYLGTTLREADVPGLRAQTGSGPIAEVNSNPNDPTIMGLKNLSSGPWTVTINGRANTVNSGQSARLAIGTQINFGSADGKIV